MKDQRIDLAVRHFRGLLEARQRGDHRGAARHEAGLEDALERLNADGREVPGQRALIGGVPECRGD